MSNDSALFLGLDIGGTKCAAVVGSGLGEVIERIGWPSQADRGPQKMLDEIFTHAQSLLQRHAGIISIGVAIGGPLNAEQGVILSPPNLPGWNNIPLKQILQDRLKFPSRVEHDAAACCLAEFTWGAGRGTSRLIYLTCGTGFGAGMVFDGKIYHGANGASPEIGHARFRPEGPDAFGKSGSVESFCAGASLGKLASWKFPSRWPKPPTPEDLADLWRAGDPDATEIIELNARSTGEVCAILADLVRPDAILLGSLATHLGQNWLKIVQSQFQAEVLTECRLAPAGLGPRLQDCSALVVAIP